MIDVPQTWEYLEKMQDRVIRFVVKHSRVEEWRLREMMFRSGELARDIGTVLIGREAAECGLIDEVGGLGRVITKLRELIDAARQQRSVPVQ